jgi:glycosyltransferase involved in cell wall biosynthesis
MEKVKEFPLVSIYAVCHKQVDYVVETLESIRNQAYPNIELIIINNVEDECEATIRNWINQHNVKCIFIQNKVPKTVTENCNMGLSLCNGKYFQGTACDDILLPHKIGKQVEVFETLNDSYAVVYGDMIYIDENGIANVKETVQEKKHLKWGTKLFPSGNLKNELSLLAFVPAPSGLLRTNVVKGLNGYDESYLVEDWPLWIKLCKHNYNFMPIEAPLVKYRVLSNSLGSNTNPAYLESLAKFYINHLDFFNFSNKNTFLNFYTTLYSLHFKLDHLLLLLKVISRSRELYYAKYLIRFILR